MQWRINFAKDLRRHKFSFYTGPDTIFTPLITHKLLTINYKLQTTNYSN